MTLLQEDLWRDGGPETTVGRLVRPVARAGELCFRLGVAARNTCYRRGWFHQERPPLATVSIGGIEVGGCGKTPLAMELLRIAARAGLRPVILTRGYGRVRSITGSPAQRVPAPPPPESTGRASGPAASAEVFGDEPVWLASKAAGLGTHVYVARERIKAARLAAKEGAWIAILDDGFQHRCLHRDGDVVTMLGHSPLGNGRLLPAGPLREPPEVALRRADRVVLAGVEPAEVDAAVSRIRPFLRTGTEVLTWHDGAQLRPVSPASADPPKPGEAVHLLAGIAHPERLVASLRKLGNPVESFWVFPDHHRYRAADLRELVSTARADSSWIVTTEKDWTRLQPVLPPGTRVAVLAQRLIWNEPEAVASWTAWFARIVAGAPGFRMEPRFPDLAGAAAGDLWPDTSEPGGPQAEA